MIRRVLNAYFIEVTKAVRQKSTYVGPVLVVAVILAAPLARPLSQDGASDYEFIAYAIPLALNVLGFVVLLIYSAGLVSSEMATGTIRMTLVRPLRRREFVAAKFFMGITYAIVLSICAAVTAWCLTYALGDLTGVRYGGEAIYTDRDMRITFAVALLLNFLPQFAAVSYGLMISTCTRNPSAAIATSVGLWILCDTIKYPLNISSYIFTTYLESSWQVFADRAIAIDAHWFPAAQQAIAASAAAIVIFNLLAVFILSRRNLYA